MRVLGVEIDRGDAAPILALVGAVVVLFGDALVRPDALLYSEPSDAVPQFYPWRVYLQERLAAGGLPLWNPYDFFGSPHVANPQVGAFFPLDRLLFGLLPHPLAFSYGMALFVLWAGLGTYLLLGRYGVPRTGRTVAAGSFMLSSVTVTRVYAGQYSLVAAIGLLPFVLLAFERALASGRRWHAAVAGSLVAFGTLAGHVQYVYMVVLFVGVYTLFRLPDLAPPGPRAWLRRLVGTYGLAGLVAVLLSAVQVLPTLYFSRFSTRSGGLALAESATVDLSPFQLVQFLTPRLFGTPVGGPMLDLDNYWGYAFYAGTAAVLLAALALTRYRDSRVYAAVATGGLSLLLSVGTLLPAYGLFYRLVPFADRFRAPGRFTLFVAFTVAVLAGLGYARLDPEETGPGPTGAAMGELRRREWALPGLVVAGTALLAVLVWTVDLRTTVVGEVPGLYGLMRQEVLLALALCLLAAGALVALRRYPGPATRVGLVGIVLLSLLAYQGAFVVARPTDAVFADTPIETEGRLYDTRPTLTSNEYQSPLLYEEANLLERTRSVGGYNSLLLGHSRGTLERLQRQPEAGEPVLDALNVTHVLGERPPGPGYEPAGQAGETAVYRNTDARSAAFLVPGAEGRTGVTVASDAALDRARDLPVERAPERVSTRVDADRAGVVVVSRAWYPLWSAEVDGEPARVVRTDAGLMAVAVPAGSHRVTLRYSSWPLEVGMLLSLAGLALVAFLWLQQRGPPADGHAGSGPGSDASSSSTANAQA